MPAERNGPYGTQHVALQNARLAGSSRQRRRADNATMLAIEPPQVCRACDDVLRRRAAAVAREDGGERSPQAGVERTDRAA
jgi:hypothetical protein